MKFWFITSDWSGLLCAGITYFVVVFVYFGFIRIGIWEDMLKGSLSALVHFIIFQYHCFMIFWCHFRTMTTEPGCIPADIEVLNFDLLPKHIRIMIEQIGTRMKQLDILIKEEKIIEQTLDRKDIGKLALGAEDTSSSEGDSDDPDYYERR